MRASAPVRKIILIWKNLPFWVCVAKLRTNFLLATRHRILGNSLLFTRYSLFFACYLLLFARYLLLFTNYSLIFTRYLFLFTRYPLLFTFYPLIFTRYSFLFTRYLLLLTRYLLLTICYSLRFTPRYYLLVTRHYFLMFSVDDNNHQPHDIQVHNFIQELRKKCSKSTFWVISHQRNHNKKFSSKVLKSDYSFEKRLQNLNFQIAHVLHH